MLRIIKTQLLVNLREKSGVFWTLLFPLILATLFHFAIGGIESFGKMEKIKAAIVTEEGSSSEEKASQEMFAEYLETFQDSYLEVIPLSLKEAEKQLENDEITGVFYNNSEKLLAVGRSSVFSSVLKQILDIYVKNEYTLKKIMEEHPENLEKAVQVMGDYENVTEKVTAGRKSMNTVQTYFFALLAMACMYGSFLAMYNTVGVQANTSDLGARVCAGCVEKWKSIAGSLLSAWILNLGEILILVFYMQVILKDIDGQGQMGKILLICVISCFCSSSLGLLVGTAGKINAKDKNGLIISISMVCSFMADLMVRGIKYGIEEHIPVLNRINPAALISDAFYSVLVYEDMQRYFRCLLGLLGLGLVMFAAAVLSMRRMRYESI